MSASTSDPGASTKSVDPVFAWIQALFPDAGVKMIIGSTAECVTAWAVPPELRRDDDDQSPKMSSRIIHVFSAPPSDEARSRFSDVVSRLRAIQHPGIVPLVDAGERSGHPFIIFGCPAGMTARQAAAASGGRFEPTRAVDLVTAVSSAVARLHESGLYHGGINPDNILIGDDGRPWLLAPAVETLFDWLAEVRTTRYAKWSNGQRTHLAPEQSDRCRAPDYRCDLYAIGALLFTSLTGNHHSVTFKAVSKECGLDQSIDGIIASCLQMDPAGRPPSAKSLARALGGVNPGSRPRALSLITTDPYTGQEVPAGKVPDGISLKTLILTVAALVIAIGGGTWAYIHKSSDLKPETPGASEPEVERAMTEDEIRTALAGCEMDLDAIRKLAAHCIRHGRAKFVAKLMAEHISRTPKGVTGLAEMQAFAEKFTARIAAYDGAMALAGTAREKNQSDQERNHLLEALKQLEDEPAALAQLSENPVEIEIHIKAAIAKMRKGLEDPAVPFNASYHIERDSVLLDLSGNPALVDIGLLDGIVVDELDLSNTGVADLAPLGGLRLRRIWLDGTKVTSLEPLAGMPLNTLTFQRTPIDLGTIVDDFKDLGTVRHNLSGDGSQVTVLPSPDPELPWENALGMRFRPAPGNPGVLLATAKTRVQDFQAFVDDTSHRMPALTYIPDETPEGGSNEEVSWSHASLAPSSRYPVVGVSYRDAAAFCAWITKRDRMAGHIPVSASYRLPTDAEWSAAAGLVDHPEQQPAARELEGLPRVVKLNTSGKVPASHAHGIGPFRGLMANVREWTETPYSDASTALAVRGSVMPKALATVTVDLRARRPEEADTHRADIGFRVALVLESPPESEGLVTLLERGDDAEAFVQSRVIVAQAASEPVTPKMLLRVSMAESLLVLEAVAMNRTKGTALLEGVSRKISSYKASHYLHVDVPVTWNTARRLARSAGGHLVYIGETGELSALTEMLIAAKEKAPTSVWLGATVRTALNEPAWAWPGDQHLFPSFVTPRNEDDRLLLTPQPTGDGAVEFGWACRHRGERFRFVIEWDS